MVEGMRLKFGQRQNDWRCCFCCHVRTGTIVLGIWHLLLHVMALSVIAVMLRHPELAIDDEQLARDPVLPTPLSSEVENREHHSRLFPEYPELRDPSDFPAPSTMYASGEARLGHRQTFNHQNLNVGVVVTFCTFLITLLMVYGAVKGKPSYLMPFFCLQVFDFCIASLTAVGYLCYPPDVRRLVERNPQLPFREHLMEMNLQCLSLLTVCAFMGMMVLKAYFIHVVWGCYKYLSLRQTAQQRTIHYIDPDSQTLLPDLPDYETALCDPRFQPPPSMKKMPPPPPSYATVAASFPSPLPTEYGPPPPPPPGFTAAIPPAPSASPVPPQPVSSGTSLPGQNA
ncbi:Lysosomal-associated transmembrane protein 4B [Gryllus bimaculatus]|nr:Lysosomal-associated transmembrane protein 4B [Gryllus bimaculatus]